MSTETLAPQQRTPKPKWLRVKLPTGKKYTALRGLVDKYNLHTICTSGSCPNMGECWTEGTATFMILGDICTRACKFCNVKTGKPLPVDTNEPTKVAESVKELQEKAKAFAERHGVEHAFSYEEIVNCKKSITGQFLKKKL